MQLPGKPQTAQHRIPLVGADSISARGPCGGAGSRGRINPAPTNKFYVLGQPGRPRPRVIATSVEDDACIVPGTSRCRGAPGRDLRPKSRRCAAVGLRNAPAGGINPAPTNLPKRPVKPDGHGHPGGRRAGCPHPAGPCGGADTRGRIWNPPLRPAARRMAKRETTNPAALQTRVGADSISARTAAARGSPGGINPAPTNKIICFGPTGTATATRAAVGRMPSSRRTLRRRKVAILKSPRCGGRERPPYRTGKTWRPTGKARRPPGPGRQKRPRKINTPSRPGPAVVFHFAADGIGEPTGDRPAPALDKAMRQAYHQRRVSQLSRQK